MDTTILKGLLNNAALLLAMCLLYDTVALSREPVRPAVRDAVSGFILGVIGVAVMLNPLQWYSGIIFDTRSVLLCVSGLFFGPVATAVAMGMTGAYRFYLGGSGTLVGIAVIAATGGIGMLWRRLRRTAPEDFSFLDFYVFGLFVHAVMMSLMLLLPGGLVAETMLRIGLPVMTVYPVATVLLGKLMAGRHKRDQTAEALRESEERWQFALEGSGDGVWDNDIRTGKNYYSDQCKRMLGYEPDEIGDSFDAWLNRVHPDDRERVLEEAQRHLRGEVPVYVAEFRIRCRDGSYKWVLSRGKVMARNERGEPLRIVGTHSDITHRKLLEEQLTRSQKMEAVGQLAGGVAHDFNNILTTIIGRAYLLESRLADQRDLLAHVEQITMAAERAAALTQRLLAFSREEVVELRRLSLNDVVRNSSDLLSRLVCGDVEITYRLAETSPVVLADEVRLSQILMNLAANARDAISGAGSILISTDTSRIECPGGSPGGDVPCGDYALLSVADTGSGLDEGVRERIFEPFFTTKEVGKGTGLGLAVVYGIVRQHNGFISVRSEPGRGTTFTVHLPLVEGAPDDREAGVEAPVPRGDGTILVAEDEDAVRALMKAILVENGYRVIEAENGVEAVARFMENRDGIDAVLLDVIMPRMNGRQACEEIVKVRPDVKILFVSGYAGDFLDADLQKRGENGFIQKPLRPGEFISRIRQTLGTADSSRRGTIHDLAS
ncbi:MAG: PAS domain-containing protein [Geobacteraceae bacterium]|nr:PAS domain-containing protein [Geobacteraceae bacterium]